MNSFDYQAALDEGYSKEEIDNYLKSKPQYKKNPGTIWGNIKANASNFYNNLFNPTGEKESESKQEIGIGKKYLKKFPSFDYQAAIEEGYSPEEIEDYLEEQIPKRSIGEKAGRVGAQFGLGLAEMELLPYELATMPLASKEAQTAAYRDQLFDEREQLEIQKASGNWNEKDQALLDHINEQIADPRKAMQYAQTLDIGVRGLAEKATGLDLQPEGILEHAAGWTSFLKDPKKGITLLKDIAKDPKNLYKGIKEAIPGVKAARGLAAATAIEMAEEGDFGPAGTLAAAIAGDIIGHAPAGIKKAITQPKKTAASLFNLVTRDNSKNKWIQDLVNTAKKEGVQLDAGTLTNSNLVRMLQARAAQSALTGDALENFRKDLSDQIIRKYQEIGNTIGDLTFESSYQAGEAIKNALKVEEKNLPFFKDFEKEARPLTGRIATQEQPLYQQELLNKISPKEFANDYKAGETLKTVAQDIRTPIKEEFEKRWSAFDELIANVEGPHAELAGELERFVTNNRGSLLLGESAPEFRAIRSAEELLNKLRVEGGLIGVSLDDLVKTKRTLADIANWEFGGSNFESRYKELVGYIDNAINRTLQEVSPELMEFYHQLNAEYSAFKDLFENKNILPLFEPKNENYNAIYNAFLSNPDKLRALEDAFILSPRGKEVLDQVKRDYAQRITSKKDLTDRDLRNLVQALGPDYADAVSNYSRLRDQALAHPLPRAAERSPIGAKVERPQVKPSKELVPSRVKESNIHVRKKLYDYLSKKDPSQVMKMMDTVEGVRKLKKVLSLTPEGKELFKKLSRYKLEEMIGNKMKNDLTNHVKLGTFSGLLKHSEDRLLIKELIGEEAYERLRNLQKISSKIEESVTRFHNASKSGTTIADVAAISSAMTGLVTGNPFLAMKVVGGIVGMRVAAKLFGDKDFLKYLEQAVLTKSDKKFMDILKKMTPKYQAALLEAKRSVENEESISSDES